jgi:hypothetical protein
VEKINGALTILREKKQLANRWLESTLRHAVAARKKSIELRGNAIKNLNIPMRPSAPLQRPNAQPASQETVLITAMPSTPSNSHQWDVFISHASEDKSYVEPLVEALKSAHIDVWYDRLVLEWGDDLRRKIDFGLANCKFGIVVFSKSFLASKKWTDHEFNGLFALEKRGRKLILPIWHGITGDELLGYSPAFANRLAKDSSKDSYEDIRDSLLRLLDRPIADRPFKQAPQQPSEEGETVAHVTYHTRNGERPAMYVRKSANREDSFILHYVDGGIEEGDKPEIAIKYTLANKRLIMAGYKQQNVSGGGLHPEFNL